MKSMELFCASPASTAICSSMDHRAIVRLGGGATPRSKSNAAPCSSHQLPIDPSRPFYHKPRKSSKQNQEILRRKSSADVDDLRGLQSSSRYLLSEYKPSESPVYNPSLTLEKVSSGKLKDHLNARKSLLSPSNHQVVELRVSIHCKGCEGKLRKHISRMEGVTSYIIDLATKKVTVIGDVTPLRVLTSISKVKNAQFWSSPTSSSSSFSSSSTPRVMIHGHF